MKKLYPAKTGQVTLKNSKGQRAIKTIIILGFITIALLIGIILFVRVVKADSSGPRDGGTFGADSTVGTLNWTNPSSANSSDDIYAKSNTSLATGRVTYYLKATNFGFGIPSGATIDGILVEVEASKTGGLALPKIVQQKLLKGGL